MIRPCPRMIVAALRGGCGKTTVTLGLVSAWRRQGLSIIPFKKGPDYIDAGWLAQAAESPCYNLDPYLMTREQMLRSFTRRIEDAAADGALIEGNRGLYDGTDAAGTYSTAELAKLLQAPTLLIVDCTKATRTLAAVVYGCQKFDSDVNLAGVILNQVATGRQEKLVRRTIEEATGIPVLGAVPRVRDYDLPERHLGLVPHQEHPRARESLDLLARLAGEHIDLDAAWGVACSAPPWVGEHGGLWTTPVPESLPRVTIGVIRDSVFQFYYPENLEALERLGARLVIFSALDATRLPELDALYLGGGFPETQAEILAKNQELQDCIRRMADGGLPVYAECGGLMYLGKELVLDHRTYPMTGIFPVSFGLEQRPQGHGYTIVTPDAPNPYYPAGMELVGHEFHYSRPLSYDPNKVNLVFKVKRGHGFDQGRDGLVSNNCLATYTHLHALGTNYWAESLVRLAGDYAGRRVDCREATP